MSDQAAGPGGFLDPEFLKCPYPFLKNIREAAPVMYLEGFGPDGMYLVSGYEVARQVLLDPGRFSNIVNIRSNQFTQISYLIHKGDLRSQE